jgi:hypothetical protein
VNEKNVQDITIQSSCIICIQGREYIVLASNISIYILDTHTEKIIYTFKHKPHTYHKASHMMKARHIIKSDKQGSYFISYLKDIKGSYVALIGYNTETECFELSHNIYKEDGISSAYISNEGNYITIVDSLYKNVDITTSYPLYSYQDIRYSICIKGKQPSCVRISADELFCAYYDTFHTCINVYYIDPQEIMYGLHHALKKITSIDVQHTKLKDMFFNKDNSITVVTEEGLYVYGTIKDMNIHEMTECCTQKNMIYNSGCPQNTLIVTNYKH